jgi:hypothetical protein
MFLLLGLSLYSWAEPKETNKGAKGDNKPSERRFQATTSLATDADAARAPMLLIRARTQGLAQVGCEEKPCGLPHLSARIRPQQPAERTRKCSGTPRR